jgi:hypothetical protein
MTGRLGDKQDGNIHDDVGAAAGRHHGVRQRFYFRSNAVRPQASGAEDSKGRPEPWLDGGHKAPCETDAC